MTDLMSLPEEKIRELLYAYFFAHGDCTVRRHGHAIEVALGLEATEYTKRAYLQTFGKYAEIRVDEGWRRYRTYLDRTFEWLTYDAILRYIFIVRGRIPLQPSIYRNSRYTVLLRYVPHDPVALFP